MKEQLSSKDLLTANFRHKKSALSFAIIIITFLTILSSNSFCEIIVKGDKTIYTGNVLEPGVTIIESATAPENPFLGLIWRDITDNTVYTYNGTAWVVKRTTPAIKSEIAIFKANIAGVTDPKAKACLKSMARILLKIYKESAE